MNLLALDTTTDIASVALYLGDEIKSLTHSSIKQHTQALLPMILRVLQEADVTLATLDGIVFGSGPGSFTGLRIACSIAKALAYAHDLPLYGVCSLEAIVQQVPVADKEIAVLAVMDARMQEVYWAYYPPGWQAATVQVTAPHAVVIPGSDVIIAGFGVDQIEWPPALKAAIVRGYTIAPNARALIERVLLGQIPAISARDAVPLYVRNQVTAMDRGAHG